MSQSEHITDSEYPLLSTIPSGYLNLRNVISYCTRGSFRLLPVIILFNFCCILAPISCFCFHCPPLSYATQTYFSLNSLLLRLRNCLFHMTGSRHMWLFTLIKLKLSVLQSYQPHLKYSIGSCGLWILCCMAQIMECYQHCSKLYWRELFSNRETVVSKGSFQDSLEGKL